MLVKYVDMMIALIAQYVEQLLYVNVIGILIVNSVLEVKLNRIFFIIMNILINVKMIFLLKLKNIIVEIHK